MKGNVYIMGMDMMTISKRSEQDSIVVGDNKLKRALVLGMSCIVAFATSSKANYGRYQLGVGVE